MSIGAIAGVAVIAAFVAVLLRTQRPEWAMALGVGVGVLLLFAVLRELSAVVNAVRTLWETASLASSHGTIVFKAMGICLISQLAADACEDAGEKAIAKKVELTGKVLLVALSLPLFETVAQLAVSLIGGEASG